MIRLLSGKIGQLPQAAAYGVTISTEKGLICVGGATATHSLSDVFLYLCKRRFEKGYVTILTCNYR